MSTIPLVPQATLVDIPRGTAVLAVAEAFESGACALEAARPRGLFSVGR